MTASRGLRLVGAAHGRLVHGRRVQALAAAIAPLLERGWRVLDVGCGDGALGALLAERVPGLLVEGVEVQVRARCAIPVAPFDGRRLPFADRSADAVLLVDVLHHVEAPLELLREAARVAAKAVIVKDHRTARPMAVPLLRLMDWIGNRAHGVPLPGTYWPEAQWRDAWRELGLVPDHEQVRLGLYPWPAGLLFEDGLHFLARLRHGASA
jgi:ubiquinone/menaquinone biosynthesis C-methylase UbiE